MNNTLVTVITVCYNSSKTIRDTLNSILKQTYLNIEYIVIDGQSQDKTTEILKEFEPLFNKKKIDFWWISEADEGIYHAMNKGLQKAKGNLIGILNSDDFYEPNAIKKIVDKNKNQTFTIISGKKNKVNIEKKVLKTFNNKKNIKKYIGKTMPINHPATFVHKTVYENVGFFDTQYKLSADYDFIYRAYLNNVKFLFVDEVLVNMRNTGATHQTKNMFITLKEDYHIRKKNNVFLSEFYFLKRLVFNFLVILRNTILK